LKGLVSGSNAYAGSAATILNRTFGQTAFTATSLDLPGIPFAFPSFQAAAEQAGMSRIYGGIHTRSANRRGLKLGRDIANYVLSV
jgi:hypothetical protein